MDSHRFAVHFSFASFEEVIEGTTVLFQESCIGFLITRTPAGNYMAWDDIELDIERVGVFSDYEEAALYLEFLREKYR